MLLPTCVASPIVATASGAAATDACTRAWNATADGDANTHGHRHNGAPEVRTTTVMMSMRSQAPTHCCRGVEPHAAHPARVATTGLPPQGATAEVDHVARPLLPSNGEAPMVQVGSVLAARAGICRDEVADATFR